MAYNLNTLTVRKSEIIKADKIQFIIDNLKKMSNDIIIKKFTKLT